MTETGRELEAVTANTERSRWVALVVLCVGMLMIVLDATVTNVALPSIQSDLGFSQSALAWVVNAYLIAFGGLLLPHRRRRNQTACGAVNGPPAPSASPGR